MTNALIRHDLRNDLSVVTGHAKLRAIGDAPEHSLAVVGRKVDEALERIESNRAVTHVLTDGVDRRLAPRPGQATPALRSVVDNLVENTGENGGGPDATVEMA